MIEITKIDVMMNGIRGDEPYRGIQNYKKTKTCYKRNIWFNWFKTHGTIVKTVRFSKSLKSQEAKT